MHLGVRQRANYRLFSYGDASAIQAAAEAAADRAEAAAANVNALVSPVDLTALAALTAAEVTVGSSIEVLSSPGRFRVLSGSAVSNGYAVDGVVIVENDAGDTTFIRSDWIDKNEVNLLWFAPPLDGTSDCATAITNWYTTVNALAALRGRCQAVVPDIGVAFKTSVPVLMGSGFVLTGGGLLECHPNMPQATNLLRSKSLSAGLNNYAQDYIELNNIRLSGGNRNLTIGQLQGLVRIYSTERVVIGDNVKAYDNQSHLLAFAGNGSLTFGDNIELYNWGHPSNGIAITGAADNGSGNIRLTVTSTATMTTGDIRIVNGVEGVTNANGSWTVTVIDGTTVDLQGSTFAGVFSGNTGKLSSGIDGGSAIICLYNPFDNTPHRNVQIGEGVYIHNGNWNGIQMNASGYVINGVRIFSSKETGIFARQESSSNQSSEGIISNCNINGVKRAYIDANGITAGGVRAKIIGNMITNCDYAGISAVAEQFDMNIESNTILNGNMDPVQFPGGGGITLRDVLAGGGPRYVRINNNTIRDIQASKTAAYGIRAFSMSPGTAMNDIEIVNNTLTESSAAPGNELVIAPSAVGVRWKVHSNTGAEQVALGYEVLPIIDSVSNVSLTNNDTGKLFTTAGATALVQYTLPNPSRGLRYGFYVSTANELRVKASGGVALIRVGSSVSTAGGIASSTTVGSVLWLFSNENGWQADSWNGTWTTA